MEPIQIGEKRRVQLPVIGQAKAKAEPAFALDIDAELQKFEAEQRASLGLDGEKRHWVDANPRVFTADQRAHTTLLVGMPTGEPWSGGRYYNSVVALGSEAGRYDKRHLVPFGEFIPFRSWIPIPKITVGTVDFSRGSVRHSLTLPGLPPIKPLICYEAIFPEMSEGAYPAWILNITNDAWFGDSPGPYQHLAMSRVRAVEQGVPLIRVANTGMSAVIDSYGRVLKRLPLNTRGIIDTALPKPISR